MAEQSIAIRYEETIVFLFFGKSHMISEGARVSEGVYSALDFLFVKACAPVGSESLTKLQNVVMILYFNEISHDGDTYLSM